MADIRLKSKILNMSTIFSIVNMTTTVSTRLPEIDARQIEIFSRELNLDKSTFIKQPILDSIKNYKVKRAFDLYKKGEISLWKAAQLAGKTLWEMIELMREYDAHLNYSVEDLEEDIKNIK